MHFKIKIMNIVLYIIIGLIIGLLVFFLLNKKHTKDFFELDKQKSVLESSYRQTLEEHTETKKMLEKERETSGSQSSKIAVLENENKNLSEKLQSQKVEIEELQSRLTIEFENIANKILKERAQEFSQSNQKNLGEILNPLKEKIQTFEKKVEETYNNETREKAMLRQEIKSLVELSGKMQIETTNLTKALKGDVKKQGNWGEIILERVLEVSGLKKGIEYQREVVIDGLLGEKLRPDVIVYLPDRKHIIIDSKVSLTDYDRMIESDESSYNEHLKKHIASLKSHVKELADKNYPASATLNAPDFVLMFVPIEASFSVAMQADSDLFMYAWERKIAIVSPTSLLVTLQTIASVWKQENQKNNVFEIAKESGLLYDKFVGFIDDLIKVGQTMDASKKIYADAMNKLTESTKKGDTIIGRFERIKELGAKATKNLPQNIVDRAIEKF